MMCVWGMFPVALFSVAKHWKQTDGASREGRRLIPGGQCPLRLQDKWENS